MSEHGGRIYTIGKNGYPRANLAVDERVGSVQIEAAAAIGITEYGNGTLHIR